MKAYIYFSLLSSVMFTGAAFAACTPSPDCASLGYTATSCPNGGVKCPFDTSKWHCNECGADYKYTCSGTGYTDGAGSVCDGKYASCNCAAGYVWRDGGCGKYLAPVGSCCNDELTWTASYAECKKHYELEDCEQVKAFCIASGSKVNFRGPYSGGLGNYTDIILLYYCKFD